MSGQHKASPGVAAKTKVRDGRQPGRHAARSSSAGRADTHESDNVLPGALGEAVSRRTVLRGSAGLATLVVGSRVPLGTGFSVVPARQAESLADAFGVVIHLNFQGDIYGNYHAVVAKMLELGARHARSRLVPRLSNVRGGFTALAAGGCQISGTCQLFGDRTQPTNRDLMNEVAGYYGGQASGVFSSFEGVNEPNNNGVPWVAETRARTIDLWQQAKSNPKTDNIPIIGPSLADTTTLRQDYQALGDLTRYTDYGSIHMYPRGTSPSTLINTHVGYARASYGSQPFICTEGGYNNAMNQNRLRPVPEGVAGKYAPRHLLEHFIRGNRFFRYELLDDVDPSKSVWESNFGLVGVGSKDPSTWTNKLAFTAMKNMLDLIGDRGRPFTPTGLALKITGGSRDLRSVLLQKRNGKHYLCLWRDISVYDPNHRQYERIAPQHITVTLQKAAPASVFKPTRQAAPVATYASTTSVTLPLRGTVKIIRVG